MTLAPGARLGPYEIVAPIGAGGMGEVYRASDTKPKRDVALKVLPDSFASDPDPSAGSGSPRASSRGDRLARFTREAQTLASLNHPNIAHIHGLEESGGVTAIVMELVEGDDLSQRIARGAIPIEEALPIAKQIAEALEAAHKHECRGADRQQCEGLRQAVGNTERCSRESSEWGDESSLHYSPC
jgi:serine/threonine protein kinase